MLNEIHILASGDGKDLLETIFFVVIAVISIFGSLIGKFLKKNDENEATPSVDESIFGNWQEEEEENPETSTLPPPIVVDYGNTSAYDKQLRERRRQTLLAQARERIAKQTRVDGSNVHAAIRKTALVPAPKHQSTLPAAPAEPPVKTADANADDDIFADREALRRAVLAQEILSPPLSLR